MTSTPVAEDNGVVHFNLDTAQRPESQQFETFYAVVRDRRIPISDPAEIDYRDLLQVDTPLKFFKYCMSQEDRDWLAEQNLKGWEIGLILEAYLQHYRAKERVDERLQQREKLGF